MKKLFAILLCLSMLLAVAACGKDEEKTPDATEPSFGQTTGVQPLWEDDGPKSDVYTLVETVYKNHVAGTEGKMTIEFDEKGQILKGFNDADDDYVLQAELEFDVNGFPAAVTLQMDGKVWDRVALTWDIDGNLVKEDYAEHNDQDCEYTYNRVGAVLKEGTADNYYEYVYEADGLVVGRRWYRDGVVREVRDYKYAYGLVTECQKNSFDSNGNLSSTTVETYDQYGNLILSRTTYQDETKAAREDHYEYTYDEKGNMLSNDFYRDGKYMYGYTYTYDADGNRTSERADGELQYESVYTNGGKNVTTKTYKDGDEISSIIEYEYDEQGNELHYLKTKNEEAQNERISTYKTFSLTKRQARVFEAMLELLSELEVYNG